MLLSYPPFPLPDSYYRCSGSIALPLFCPFSRAQQQSGGIPFLNVMSWFSGRLGRRAWGSLQMSLGGDGRLWEPGKSWLHEREACSNVILILGGAVHEVSLFPLYVPYCISWSLFGLSVSSNQKITWQIRDPFFAQNRMKIDAEELHTANEDAEQETHHPPCVSSKHSPLHTLCGVSKPVKADMLLMRWTQCSSYLLGALLSVHSW